MERMANSLEQFVSLDAPFSLDERYKRINQVRNTLSDPKVTASEQVRQVLEAYNIEREYGRTIETYEDAIVLGGEEKVVNILRIGRLALMYQLKDQSEAGVWDAEAGEWVEVSGYRLPVRDGIRMANKTAPLDLLAVPVKFVEGE
jgi:lipopolysaccharide biosynthesis regulator YciM